MARLGSLLVYVTERLVIDASPSATSRRIWTKPSLLWKKQYLVLGDLELIASFRVEA